MKKFGSLGQFEARCDAVGSGTADRDPAMGSEGRAPFLGSAITIADDQCVAGQELCDQIVVGDVDQQAEGIDDV